MPRAAIVIPARWGSSRLPGKPLLELGGKPVIQHVWERCSAVTGADLVIVATDDMRIAEAAFAFGAEVSMTSPDHPTGTDRIAEVARRLPRHTLIVNVQGDEPFIDPVLVESLIATLQADRSLAIATAACPLDPCDLVNPACVKVVCDLHGRALYFSRAPIPADRDGDVHPARLRHLGVYAYRRRFLLDFVSWEQTPLEKAEKLEQLRALEHGAQIRVLPVPAAGPGIDTPGDWEAACRLLENRPLA